jgi:hypothetical protein
VNDDVARVVVNRCETDPIVIRCCDADAERSSLGCIDIRFAYEFAVPRKFHAGSLGRPEFNFSPKTKLNGHAFIPAKTLLFLF